MLDASTCSCKYHPDDYPESVVLKRVVHRARKAHECCECGETIQPGQRYLHEAIICDGCLDSYKTCLTCVAVGTDLLRCGWTYGDMWTQIHQEYCGEGCTCLRKRDKHVENTGD